MFQVAHVEVDAAAIQETPAISRRLLVIAIMQIDHPGAHLAKEMILHPHRPGVAVRMRRLAAHQATILRLESGDPIHRLRASATRWEWTRDNARRIFRGWQLFPRAVRLKRL